MGKIFGYARVSTQDQNLNLQIDALEKAGAVVIYKEKMTGAKKERPELEQLLKAISESDSVVVYKLDRISRSTKHLIELAETFEEKKVNFISIQDSIDTSTAMGRFFFRTMASIAELERDIISERTKSGLQSARMRGRNGGRPFKDPKLVERALKLHSSKQYRGIVRKMRIYNVKQVFLTITPFLTTLRKF
ncbi:recombinase family protein [Sutcliffiella horikoshii]|uniref:recombinase family protein n=1 Tax=Sutcliffiella horikoshii TaxID=79883 RepID=UPI00299E0218|nr:recombinase family protein [Sutcliffiella horikoshii]